MHAESDGKLAAHLEKVLGIKGLNGFMVAGALADLIPPAPPALLPRELIDAAVQQALAAKAKQEEQGFVPFCVVLHDVLTSQCR